MTAAGSGLALGTLPAGLDTAAIVERATPSGCDLTGSSRMVGWEEESFRDA